IGGLFIHLYLEGVLVLKKKGPPIFVIPEKNKKGVFIFKKTGDLNFNPALVFGGFFV
ncbi:hypothetical protein EBI_26293, partial [Enterocytozoon bieneusi H348]